MAALIQQGVSKGKILGDIRENRMQGGAFKHYHLTDMKDLSNISRAFQWFGGQVQRSENDQESVRAWIQEWQESGNNPVLFYKLQGEQAPEDLDLLLHSHPDPLPKGNGPKVRYQRCLYRLNTWNYRI